VGLLGISGSVPSKNTHEALEPLAVINTICGKKQKGGKKCIEKFIDQKEVRLNHREGNRGRKQSQSQGSWGTTLNEGSATGSIAGLGDDDQYGTSNIRVGRGKKEGKTEHRYLGFGTRTINNGQGGKKI